MPSRKKSEPKLDADGVYVAIIAFGTAAVPGNPVIATGTRLRGDNPIVKAVPWAFLPDGSDPNDISRAISNHWNENADQQQQAAKQYERPPAPEPIRDEDAV